MRYVVYNTYDGTLNDTYPCINVKEREYIHLAYDSNSPDYYARQVDVKNTYNGRNTHYFIDSKHIICIDMEHKKIYLKQIVPISEILSDICFRFHEQNITYKKLPDDKELIAKICMHEIQEI